MDKKSIILVIALFAMIIAGMFIFAYLKRGEIAAQPPVETTIPTEEVMYPEITRIDAKHYYIDGTHTFVGELIMPTSCDLVQGEAAVMESMPEQIRLDFTVINNADTCAQVMSVQRFKIEAIASAEATVSATFMGREVELNLIPAADGETPDEFELFIKG